MRFNQSAGYIIQVIFFTLIVLGILPREFVPYYAAGLALLVLIVPLEAAIIFFTASIPLFIAIPVTPTWDNFNTWRILSIIIFLRWLFSKGDLGWFFKGAGGFYRTPLSFISSHKIIFISSLLLIISILSLYNAPDARAGFARIIYFVNLSLVGVVVYDRVRGRELKIEDLLRAVSLSAIVAIIVGYLQLISTYLMDVYQFMRLWGEGIQLRQFGTIWSKIAVEFGNTWLAYYGPQLSLRVFSLFPDSHSFPSYLLLAIPSLFAFGIRRLTVMPEVLNSLKRLVRTYANMSVLWIPAAFLIAILSGTRGIWAASIPSLGLALILIWHLGRKTDKYRQNLFSYITLYFVVFFMLFSVAYPIFVSPQFLLSKGDWALLGERIKSIIDFGETSNAARIEIWTKSLQSIVQNPFLGVGLGNFPVVLSQNVFLARAGSSAHNLYLHIAAELGLPALALAMAFFWLIFIAAYDNFLKEKDPVLITYWGAILIFYPWLLAYNMTDAILFDERLFLVFAITSGIILGNKNRA